MSDMYANYGGCELVLHSHLNKGTTATVVIRQGKDLEEDIPLMLTSCSPAKIGLYEYYAMRTRSS